MRPRRREWQWGARRSGEPPGASGLTVGMDLKM